MQAKFDSSKVITIPYANPFNGVLRVLVEENEDEIRVGSRRTITFTIEVPVPKNITPEQALKNIARDLANKL